MDPRFRERRVEVRRDEGRRRLRVLVAITAMVVLGAAGWAATGSPLLDLDRVVVEGAVQTDPTEVRFASGLRRGQRLIDVDEAAARRAVEALPWVERASVRRRWPGEVRIRLVEREAVAAIAAQGGPAGTAAQGGPAGTAAQGGPAGTAAQGGPAGTAAQGGPAGAAAEGGGAALVDGQGRVLAHVDAPPPGLAVLTGLPPAGPPGSVLPPEGVAALSVAMALPDELRARITGVAPAGDRGEVEMVLSPTGRIRLGPPVDLDRKFDAIRAVLAQVDLANLEVLDVRRPESPVLTRQEAAVKVSTPRVG